MRRILTVVLAATLLASVPSIATADSDVSVDQVHANSMELLAGLNNGWCGSEPDTIYTDIILTAWNQTIANPSWGHSGRYLYVDMYARQQYWLTGCSGPTILVAEGWATVTFEQGSSPAWQLTADRGKLDTARLVIPQLQIDYCTYWESVPFCYQPVISIDLKWTAFGAPLPWSDVDPKPVVDTIAGQSVSVVADTWLWRDARAAGTVAGIAFSDTNYDAMGAGRSLVVSVTR